MKKEDIKSVTKADVKNIQRKSTHGNLKNPKNIWFVNWNECG
jgi:hypothetical protein